MQLIRLQVVRIVLAGWFFGNQEATQIANSGLRPDLVQIDKGALLEYELTQMPSPGCLVNPVSHASRGAHSCLSVEALHRLDFP